MGKAARAVRKGPQSEFVKKFEDLSGRYSVRQIWEDWVIMSAISISNAVDLEHAEARERDYMARAQKYSRDELQVFSDLFSDFVVAMDVNPDQDFLGEMYMAVGMGNEHSGQFFTPYNVCKMMAKVCTPDIPARVERDHWIAVNDCACGAGALLVAFANECLSQKVNYQMSVLFTAQDIDYLVGCMCYLQLSILGCPGYVKIGDSLCDPLTSYDSRGLFPKDDGYIWYTPFYFSFVWDGRRRAALMDQVLGKFKDPTTATEIQDQPLQRPIFERAEETKVITPPKPETPPEAVQTPFGEAKHGQLTFF